MGCTGKLAYCVDVFEKGPIQSDIDWMVEVNVEFLGLPPDIVRPRVVEAIHRRINKAKEHIKKCRACQKYKAAP
jgi:hypothetical protein